MLTKCRSIALSSFMPVPSSRRLLGDLAYYTVVLADERVVCVTSSVRGFYANRRSLIL
jgi:hypothetical protein